MQIPTADAHFAPTWTATSEPTARSRVHLPPVTIDEHVNHDFHLLMWQVRGQTDFTVDGRPHRNQVGHALWLPSGVRHGFTTRTDSVLLPVFLPVAGTAATVRGSTSVPVGYDLGTLLLACVQTSYTIIRPKVDLARQILTLVEVGPAATDGLPMPLGGATLAVAETLRLDPGDGRGIEELAATVHVSARTLERAFRDETGTTLRQWRIRLRMETAARLLRAPTTVDAVAQRVGYTSTSAFRRVFRTHFGVSPSDHVARFRSPRRG